MNILVLSDLHIDLRDSYGLFQWEPSDLIACIESLKEEYEIDQVVLNGDVFELYKHSFEEVQAANKALSAYLKRSEFVYIRGNHDFIAPLGRSSYEITNSSGQRILFEHGHQADFFNGSLIGQQLSKLFFGSLKYLMRYPSLASLYHKAVELEEGNKRIPRRYNSYRYLKYALKLLKKYDMVVLGHTHRMETHQTYYQHKKKLYLNCGSCSLGRLQGLVINSETLGYELIKIDKAGSSLRAIPLARIGREEEVYAVS